jgi:hypothetical protein
VVVQQVSMGAGTIPEHVLRCSCVMVARLHTFTRATEELPRGRSQDHAWSDTLDVLAFAPHPLSPHPPTGTGGASCCACGRRMATRRTGWRWRSWQVRGVMTGVVG